MNPQPMKLSLLHLKSHLPEKCFKKKIRNFFDSKTSASLESLVLTDKKWHEDPEKEGGANSLSSLPFLPPIDTSFPIVDDVIKPKITPPAPAKKKKNHKLTWILIQQSVFIKN